MGSGYGWALVKTGVGGRRQPARESGIRAGAV